MQDRLGSMDGNDECPNGAAVLPRASDCSPSAFKLRISFVIRDFVIRHSRGVGWNLSVSHNAPLGRYLLSTEHTETHRGKLGIFDAPHPWGPWTTVAYYENWGQGHVPVNTFYWNFSNKWLNSDGTHFSLIFTGRKENDSWNVLRGSFIQK